MTSLSVHLSLLVSNAPPLRGRLSRGHLYEFPINYLTTSDSHPIQLSNFGESRVKIPRSVKILKIRTFDVVRESHFSSLLRGSQTPSRSSFHRLKFIRVVTDKSNWFRTRVPFDKLVSD